MFTSWSLHSAGSLLGVHLAGTSVWCSSLRWFEFMTWCIILLRRWYTVVMKGWTWTATGLRYVGVSVHGTDSWHIRKGSISAKRCKVLLEQHLLHADVSQEGLCVWAGRRWTADCFYSSLTASEEQSPAAEPARLQSRPLTCWQHLELHESNKRTKQSQDCTAAGILHQTITDWC